MHCTTTDLLLRFSFKTFSIESVPNSFLFVRGVDLNFVLILGKSLFVLGLFFLARSLHSALHTSALPAAPDCHRSAAAVPIAYEDCSPIERFSQCCMM